jgi:hypothetical protein
MFQDRLKSALWRERFGSHNLYQQIFLVSAKYILY